MSLARCRSGDRVPVSLSVAAAAASHLDRDRGQIRLRLHLRLQVAGWRLAAARACPVSRAGVSSARRGAVRALVWQRMATWLVSRPKLLSSRLAPKLLVIGPVSCLGEATILLFVLRIEGSSCVLVVLIGMHPVSLAALLVVFGVGAFAWVVQRLEDLASRQPVRSFLILQLLWLL